MYIQHSAKMSVLIRNTFFSTLTSATQFLTNILILVLLARPLGTQEFGRLLLAYSFTAIFGILMEFGFKWYATREVSRDPAAALSITGKIFGSQLLLGSTATVVMVLFMHILDYPPQTRLVIALLWLSTIFLTLTNTLRSVFKGLNRFQYETWLQGVLFAMLVLLLAVPSIFHLGTVAFAAAILAARTIYFIFGLFLFKARLGAIGFHFDLTQAWRLTVTTLSFGIQIVLARIMLELNTVVLYQFKGNFAVGIYQAALRFILATVLISDIFIQAFFPVLSHSFKSNPAKFARAGMLLNRIQLSLGAYISGFFFIFADVFIQIAFGQAYGQAVPVLRILAFTTLLIFLSAAQSAILISCDKQYLRLKTNAMALLFNVVSTLALIPLWGAPGAAVSMAATYLLLLLVYLFFVRRTLARLFFDRRCLGALAWVLLGGALACFLKNFSLPMGILTYLILGAILFPAATSPAERREMLHALRCRNTGQRSADNV
jgi:O-antigen/teichoic acid export membrane protein